jgi:aldose 1-epimerase
VGPYDDAFEVPDGRVEITWPGALRLTCESDTRWLTVFDELPDLVCIEPHTGPPGGLARAAAVTPGAARRASVRWSWSALR